MRLLQEELFVLLFVLGAGSVGWFVRLRLRATCITMLRVVVVHEDGDECGPTRVVNAGRAKANPSLFISAISKQKTTKRLLVKLQSVAGDLGFEEAPQAQDVIRRRQ